MGQLMFGKPSIARDVFPLFETEVFWRIVGEDDVKPSKRAPGARLGQSCVLNMRQYRRPGIELQIADSTSPTQCKANLMNELPILIFNMTKSWAHPYSISHTPPSGTSMTASVPLLHGVVQSTFDASCGPVAVPAVAPFR